MIAPTGKAFDLEFGQTTKWDGERLIIIFAFWDANLQPSNSASPSPTRARAVAEAPVRLILHAALGKRGGRDVGRVAQQSRTSKDLDLSSGRSAPMRRRFGRDGAAVLLTLSFDQLAMEPARYRQDQRRQRSVCLAALALQAAFSFALLPAVPSLIGRAPVLLEALRGSTAALVAAGAFARVGQASLPLALLAPIPTLLMAGPFLWWAGRLWGPSAAEYLAGRGPRAKRRTDQAVHLLERNDSWAVVLAYLLPVPSALVYAAAGWTGMSLRRFVLLDLAGTFLWVVLIVGLGYAIGHEAVNLAHAISRYGLVLTLALIPVALLAATIRARRRIAQPADS